uniref:Adenine phosphoribosyltransferase n=1 Tax=Globodera rostochiensis TaxID=31243 RepID=A0A914HH48_GLORO
MDEKLLRNEVAACIRSVEGFPSKGVLFRDIFPLFLKPSLIRSLCSHIVQIYLGQVDVVVALEARGFLFGPMVAQEMSVPFVPIRKQGKLPGPVLSATYVKEYGQDILEVQKGALSAGQRVLVFDDLLATGGSLNAAFQLIRQSNAEVQAAFVIIELEGMNGRMKLECDKNVVTSLIKYS